MKTRLRVLLLTMSALLVLPAVARAQAPTVTAVIPTSIPQTNPATGLQPPPLSIHLQGTGFLPTTTVYFNWAGGGNPGVVHYASATSIQVTLPPVPAGITTITPTVCNSSCTGATSITLLPLSPTSGTPSANPNPATVGQATTISAVIVPGANAVPGAPSGAVGVGINGPTTGYYNLTLDKKVSSLTYTGTSILSATPQGTPLVADFNGDGVADVIFADTNIPASVHVVLGGAPAGSFQNEILLPVPTGCSFINSIAVGDFNGDGFSDYVVDCQNATNLPIITVAVYLSLGDGSFAAPVTLTNAFGSTVLVGDMNHDGKQDLVLEGLLSAPTCAANGACSLGFQIFTGNGDGTFTFSNSMVLSPAITSVENYTQFFVTDVDGDGYPDLVAFSSSGSSSIDIYRNQSNTQYGVNGGTNGNTPTYAVPLQGNPTYYQRMAIGDFNGDHLPDFAAAYTSDVAPARWGINTYLNTSTPGTISFGAAGNVPLTSTVTTLATGDINGDGNQDLIFGQPCTTGCQIPNGSTAFFMESDGRGNFSNQYPNLSLAAGSVGTLLTANLNHDNYADLLVVEAPPTSSTTAALAGYITSGNSDLTFQYDPAADGQSNITLTYPGDFNFTGTTLNLVLPVNGITANISVGSAVANPQYGQPDALVAPVSSSVAGGAVPTGQVTFYDGTLVLGTAPLVAGVASLPVSTLPAGSHLLFATYSGDSTYATASTLSPVPLVVTQATPTVSWTPAPGTIPYGTALGAGQLDATAATTYVTSVPGTFSYKPAAGTVLGVGTQALSVTFTPTDTVDFARATGTAQVVVTQATPTISWSSPAPINYGTALSATQLNATASFGALGAVAGTFTYTPAAGTVLSAGNGQALSVLFTPTDTVDYTTANGSTTINVIPLTVTQLSPATITLGAGNTPVTVTGTGFLPNSVVNLNGAPAATTYIGPTSLSVVIPAASLLTVQALKLTVTDPTQAQTSAAAVLGVIAPLAAATFTGPTTVQPAQQPTLNFALTTAYPVPITGTVTLTFEGSAGVDDPAIQFASGGRTQSFTIPANTTTTPTITLQSGTDAGTITVTLTLNAGGQTITPAGIVPLVITVPAVAPVITSMTLTRSGNTLTANIIGYSNTRDLSQATFTFTGANGGAISDPQVIVPVTAIFSTWFTSTTSQQYGSSFLYTQQFNLNNNATAIGSVAVTLTNSSGTSTSATAQ